MKTCVSSISDAPLLSTFFLPDYDWKPMNKDIAYLSMTIISTRLLTMEGQTDLDFDFRVRITFL